MDVVNAILQTCHAFMAAGLAPPKVILLSSHDDGMRLLSSVRQESQWVATAGSAELGRPIEMADGSIWMEVKIADTAVRWPANKKAMPDGSWRYV